MIGAVFRAMVTLEGTLTPAGPPASRSSRETRGLAGTWLGELVSPASLRDAAADEVIGLLPVLRRLPGGWAAPPPPWSTEPSPPAPGCSPTTGTRAILIPAARGGTTIFQALGYIGLFFSLVLILRVIVTIVREGTS